MKRKIRMTLASLALAALIIPGTVGAQGACAPFSSPVTMGLSGNIAATVPSTTLGFSTSIDNTGSTTIASALLAVDVIRQGGSNTVVDRFVVPQRVTLFGKYKGLSDFQWHVPAGLPTGNYVVNVALVPAEGLLAPAHLQSDYPNAVDTVAIKDGAQPGTEVASVSVNGQTYTHGMVAKISGTGTSVTATVHNSSSVPYIGHMTWRVYAPDATFTSTPLDERTDPVELHPGADALVAYQVSAGKTNAYYLEGVLDNGSRQTYIDVLIGTDRSAFPWLVCAGENGSATLAAARRYEAFGMLLILLIIAAYAQYHLRRSRSKHRRR